MHQLIEFQRSRAMRGWIVDDFANSLRLVFRGPLSFDGEGCRYKCIIFGEEIGQTSLHIIFYVTFRISCSTFKEGSSKTSEVEN